MIDLHFQTNINCMGCVSKVTPVLNTTEGIQSWNVDTTNSSKVLTVKTDSLTAPEIITVVEKAGFKAEML
ncbi:heavy-metal-associated domain-containing protein [Pontibacter pudoricolor]|uniref:heavy-metal-associated domain-containing protein n=1 Tax=Pontibacter pudoricolor TaxID=2694930 RepID=UPI001391FAD1|nr:heavy metal-associated domain-containing protein [Pontibacter pudoricolor]